MALLSILSDPLAWWYTDRADIARGEEADRQNEALTKKLEAQGKMSQADADLALRHYNADGGDAAQAAPIDWWNVPASALDYAQADIKTEVDAGLEQGQRNVEKTIKDTVNATAGGAARLAWGAIPWWIWALAILAAVAWLGNVLGIWSLAGRKLRSAIGTA